MVHSLEIRKFPGTPHELLGQIRVIDSRSLDFVHDWFVKQPKLKPVTWELGVPIIDQSNLISQGIFTSEFVPGVRANASALGSCTANSSVYSTSIIIPREEFEKKKIDISTAVAAEKTAISWYSMFTFADEFLSENWPSVDCGSSGLGAGKTLKKLGLISKYVHAKNAESVASLLGKGPTNWGMPWMNAFFEPDKNGFIDANSDWGVSGVAGGHEISVVALEKIVQTETGKVDLNKSYVKFANSWNTSWGDQGYGRMYLSTYQKLRGGIDVIQFRR